MSREYANTPDGLGRFGIADEAIADDSLRWEQQEEARLEVPDRVDDETLRVNRNVSEELPITDDATATPTKQSTATDSSVMRLENRRNVELEHQLCEPKRINDASSCSSSSSSSSSPSEDQDEYVKRLTTHVKSNNGASVAGTAFAVTEALRFLANRVGGELVDEDDVAAAVVIAGTAHGGEGGAAAAGTTMATTTQP